MRVDQLTDQDLILDANEVLRCIADSTDLPSADDIAILQEVIKRFSLTYKAD